MESFYIFAYQTVGIMAQDTREHILEVSLLLFLQKSYKAVTLSEIVKTTGMSKGAFYHYFDSKQELFEEVVKFYFGDVLDIQFTSYDQGSLKGFYKDFLLHNRKQLNIFEKVNPSKSDDAHINHHVLLFDAITQLPYFRRMFNEHNQQELSVSKSVTLHDKATGEIKSEDSDDNIARMFMYMGDGNAIHSIFLNRKTSEIKKFIDDLKTIWDELYKLLRNEKE